MESIETNMIRSYKDHVVIFPFPSKGHVIPLLHFSAALSAKGVGVKVTFITTPFTFAFIHDFLRLPRPNVHVKVIPFPPSAVTSLPSGVESTDQLPSLHLFPSFLHATALLNPLFHQAIQAMVNVDDDVPLCVISDFFCGWTARTCREFGIPRVVFQGLGVFSLSVNKALVDNLIKDSGFEAEMMGGSEFYVPGMPGNLRLKFSDVPDMFRKLREDPISKFMGESMEEDHGSWGVLVNSFDALEKDYVSHLQSFYFSGAKVWLVGPLCLHSPEFDDPDKNKNGNNDTSPVMEWLEAKDHSVLYVSFGTMVFWPEQQLDEIWRGLEMSGYDYLWVVRSSEWEPPTEKKHSSRGLVYREWVAQMEILRHPAVGGFLSHCGWNSVLESVTAEVPILAWPVMAEQAINTKFIVDVVEMALRLTTAGEGVVVGRESICEGVKELMGGEKGKKVREKVAEMGWAAKVAVEEGGSSCDTLNKLLDGLREIKEKNRGVSHT